MITDVDLEMTEKWLEDAGRSSKLISNRCPNGCGFLVGYLGAGEDFGGMGWQYQAAGSEDPPVPEAGAVKDRSIRMRYLQLKNSS